jgi:hypothetical protein
VLFPLNWAGDINPSSENGVVTTTLVSKKPKQYAEGGWHAATPHRIWRPGFA